MADPAGTSLDEATSSFSLDLPSYYANFIGSVTSFNDVRLAFGKHVPGSGQKLEFELYLSLVTAKQLLDILTRNLAEYEKAFGVIPTAPSTTP